MLMDLALAHQLLPGSRLVGDPRVPLQRVHTDTRTVQPGDFFVALRGERFDGHDFLPQARAAGAVAALAESGLEASALAGLEVEDTLEALQQLARAWRARLSLPLVAVTGSNGKTTVTQMTASILRAWLGDQAAATRGNLNNHIGVPLTLLSLRGAGAKAHRASVVELGMNHPGEIAELAALAQPTVGLVNNAQREHQEFMGSVEAVARENGAVLQALPMDGVAVFPVDDPFHALWREMAGARRILTFGVDQPLADVSGHVRCAGDHAELTLRTPQGLALARLHVAGRHNIHNALAAAAAALAAGAPLQAVQTGLSDFRPVQGRSCLMRVNWRGQPLSLVDDTYNANPDSVRAAIDVLSTMRGPRMLVLGDMGEVGDQGPAFHAEVGAYARDRGIEHVWLAGSLCAHAAALIPGARHFPDTASLVACLHEMPDCASMLVKGSRFMRMERVVQGLWEDHADLQEAH